MCLIFLTFSRLLVSQIVPGKNAFGILTPWQFGSMQKVVAPTGNTEHENPVRAVRLGACDYYLNP